MVAPGGVAKPPVVPRGVEVAPHPWNCSRGIMFVINSQNMAKIPVDLELIGRGLKKGCRKITIKCKDCIIGRVRNKRRENRSKPKKKYVTQIQK